MKVERGNTQKGVNVEVLSFLLELKEQGFSIANLYDMPCGQGEFLKAVKSNFPSCQTTGQDLFAKPLPEIESSFVRGGVDDTFKNNPSKKYDVVTCISGVMCFDGIANYFKNVGDHINTGGYFVVTNDNVLTVRDRLSFLIGGRLKRFKLLYDVQEGNWNVMLIQALWKQLKVNNFEIVKVKYVSWYAEDFVFLPLALILYPLWWLSFYFKKSQMSKSEKMMMFPLSALLARHYVIYARKK